MWPGASSIGVKFRCLVRPGKDGRCLCVGVNCCQSAWVGVCLWMKGRRTCVFVVGFLFEVDLCVALFCSAQRCWRVLCAVVCGVRDLVFCFQEWAFISCPIYLFPCVRMAVLFSQRLCEDVGAWGACDQSVAV